MFYVSCLNDQIQVMAVVTEKNLEKIRRTKNLRSHRTYNGLKWAMWRSHRKVEVTNKITSTVLSIKILKLIQI